MFIFFYISQNKIKEKSISLSDNYFKFTKKWILRILIETDKNILKFLIPRPCLFWHQKRSVSNWKYWNYLLGWQFLLSANFLKKKKFGALPYFVSLIINIEKLHLPSIFFYYYHLFFKGKKNRKHPLLKKFPVSRLTDPDWFMNKIITPGTQCSVTVWNHVYKKLDTVKEIWEEGKKKL